MKKIKTVGVVVALLAVVVGCDSFRDPTPDNVTIRVEGDAGTPVLAIYSKNFVAGVDELGVTQVQVFTADSVFQSLPIDTVVNISIERRMFVQVETVSTDTLAVGVLINVDDRTVLSQSGGIFPDIPFQWIFLFNLQLTDVVEVVL